LQSKAKRHGISGFRLGHFWAPLDIANPTNNAEGGIATMLSSNFRIYVLICSLAFSDGVATI